MGAQPSRKASLLILRQLVYSCLKGFLLRVVKPVIQHELTFCPSIKFLVSSGQYCNFFVDTCQYVNHKIDIINNWWRVWHLGIISLTVYYCITWHQFKTYCFYWAKKNHDVTSPHHHNFHCHHNTSYMKNTGATPGLSWWSSLPHHLWPSCSLVCSKKKYSARNHTFLQSYCWYTISIMTESR